MDSATNLGSLRASFFAGSFAGACGILIGHPFDSLKVRIQVNAQLAKQGITTEVAKQLYRGIVPPLVTAGAMQSLLFLNYENFRIILRKFAFKGDNSDMEYALYRPGRPETAVPTPHPLDVIKCKGGFDHLCIATIAGSTAGLMLATLSTPIGFVKIQQQIASEASVLAVARKSWQVGGARMMYRGFIPNVFLESPGRGIYLFTYEFVKMILNQQQHVKDGGLRHLPIHALYDKNGLHCDVEERLSTRMVAAAVAGCASWASLYPFDVIKSRMQLDRQGLKYSGTIDCFVKTYKEGGVRGLYSGLGYTLLRAAPVAATILPIYEFAKSKIEDKMNLRC